MIEDRPIPNVAPINLSIIKAIGERAEQHLRARAIRTPHQRNHRHEPRRMAPHPHPTLTIHGLVCHHLTQHQNRWYGRCQMPHARSHHIIQQAYPASEVVTNSHLNGVRVTHYTDRRRIAAIISVNPHTSCSPVIVACRRITPRAHGSHRNYNIARLGVCPSANRGDNDEITATSFSEANANEDNCGEEPQLQFWIVNHTDVVLPFGPVQPTIDNTNDRVERPPYAQSSQ